MASQAHSDVTYIMTPYCVICGAERPHRSPDYSYAEQRRQVQLHAQWHEGKPPLYNPVTGRLMAESPFTEAQREYLITFMEGMHGRQQSG